MGKQSAKAQSSVERYRERMQRSGFRLVQLWLPDTRSAKFADECRRQSLLIAHDVEHEHQIASELEQLQDTTGWEP